MLNPYEFIGAVINRRLPNPFMPDAPQRIATDTSQKLAIRFGETIKAYEERGLDKSNLVLIPLVLAGYARYLKASTTTASPSRSLPIRCWLSCRLSSTPWKSRRVSRTSAA